MEKPMNEPKITTDMIEDPERIKELKNRLDKGASPNELYFENGSLVKFLPPAFCALKNKNLEALEALLQRGIDTKAEDMWDQNLIEAAVASRRSYKLPILQMLLDAGVEVRAIILPKAKKVYGEKSAEYKMLSRAYQKQLARLSERAMDQKLKKFSEKTASSKKLQEKSRNLKGLRNNRKIH